jgi:hypothetical protein
MRCGLVLQLKDEWSGDHALFEACVKRMNLKIPLSMQVF